MTKKPDLAYTAVLRDGQWILGVAKRGVQGYSPTDYPPAESYGAARKWANELNARMGLTEREAWEIVASTMFGHDMATYRDNLERRQRQKDEAARRRARGA